MLEETKFELEQLKNQYPEIFERIPPEMIELAFSEETSSKIEEICLENQIEDEETISKIAYWVGFVLFGVLPPEELEKTLTEKVNLSSFIAAKIAKEINKSIFSLITEKLDKLYKGGNMPFKVKEISRTGPSPSEAMPGLKEKPEIEEEKPTRPPRRDTYRELIE